MAKACDIVIESLSSSAHANLLRFSYAIRTKPTTLIYVRERWRLSLLFLSLQNIFALAYRIGSPTAPGIVDTIDGFLLFSRVTRHNARYRFAMFADGHNTVGIYIYVCVRRCNTSEYKRSVKQSVCTCCRIMRAHTSAQHTILSSMLEENENNIRNGKPRIHVQETRFKIPWSSTPRCARKTIIRVLFYFYCANPILMVLYLYTCITSYPYTVLSNIGTLPEFIVLFTQISSRSR